MEVGEEALLVKTRRTPFRGALRGRSKREAPTGETERSREVMVGGRDGRIGAGADERVRLGGGSGLMGQAWG